MKNISFWFLALSSWLLMSCVDIEERDDTATGNFEALWTILDEHYCFFDYKQKEYSTNTTASLTTSRRSMALTGTKYTRNIRYASTTI